MSSSEREQLKPCPFCLGTDARMSPPTCTKRTPYNPADRAFPKVRCPCGAEKCGDDWDQSGKTAIAAWNRRTQASAEPVLFVSAEQLAAHRDPDEPGEHGRYLPTRKTPAGNFTQPLFVAVPKQTPLTDEQIDDLHGESNRGFSIEREDYFKAFRDAERAHGITAAKESNDA